MWPPEGHLRFSRYCTTHTDACVLAWPVACRRVRVLLLSKKTRLCEISLAAALGGAADDACGSWPLWLLAPPLADVWLVSCYLPAVCMCCRLQLPRICCFAATCMRELGGRPPAYVLLAAATLLLERWHAGEPKNERCAPEAGGAQALRRQAAAAARVLRRRASSSPWLCACVREGGWVRW